MASLRSNMTVLMVVVVVVLAGVALSTVLGAQLPTLGLTCPPRGILNVYPFWSTCWYPAVYYGQEVYELAAAPGNVSGSLAPEYDETNSTYYMRLADVGAKYKLMHVTLEYRFYVKQSDDIVFVNVDTGMALGWRQEGEDEMFLVETDNTTDVARFQFSTAVKVSVSLPCPRIAGARCVAYNIVTFGNRSSGLSPYEEDGATYFTKGSDVGLPFLLLRSTNSVLATKSVLSSQLAALA